LRSDGPSARGGVDTGETHTRIAENDDVELQESDLGFLDVKMRFKTASLRALRTLIGQVKVFQGGQWALAPPPGWW
jgi:hypothetical protein